MGQATVAEMTGYPGPKHVLELADNLQLTEAQRRSVQTAFDEMNGQTRRLGAQLVEAERELYRAFASNGVTSETIDALTMRIGHLQATLRARHLKAHADTRPMLTSLQVNAYRRLRGHSGH
jgi:Spy/CpxP family protein refolding chaperone